MYIFVHWRLRVCVYVYIYAHWDYVGVYVFTYMHTEITCVCIYLRICALRLRVCVYIYIYAHWDYACGYIFTYIHTETTCVCTYLHICTLRLRVCICLHICTLRLRVCVYIYIYAHRDYAWVYEGDLWSKSDIFATFWNCTKASHVRCKMASPKPFAPTKYHDKHISWSMTTLILLHVSLVRSAQTIPQISEIFLKPKSLCGN